MGSVTVRKLNPAGAPVLEYAGEVIMRTPRALCLRALWERPALKLGYVTFETHDVFTEWFFTNHWYNIFEIRAGATGDLKGWYCNVTTPARLTADHVESRDLLLDVWVWPEGRCLVLDEAEFAAHAGLDAATHAGALRGLHAVRRAVAWRAGPFRALRDHAGKDVART